jgi:hypothetical protein
LLGSSLNDALMSFGFVIGCVPHAAKDYTYNPKCQKFRRNTFGLAAPAMANERPPRPPPPVTLMR